MRSALGIRRIRDADVSQVLHASSADIQVLQNRLKAWGVKSFEDYPLLLRALTHSSISNWAERVLQIRQRSLGPNTLELLGDRVVGTCVSLHVPAMREGGKLDQLAFRTRPTTLLNSLVGNRGMAQVATNIGVAELMRWEKSRRPASQRERLDPRGVDHVTGLMSNVEINGLAAAYEAITAAIYLDGGIDAASSFVKTTLLEEPKMVQNANMDVRQQEEALAVEIDSVLGESVSFVRSRYRPGRSASMPIWSHERLQCEILDLESTKPTNQAHQLYYAAVMLRPMSEVQQAPREDDVLYVASHFSVESARLAALVGTIEMLRGRKDGRAMASDIGDTYCEKLRMREIVFGQGAPEVQVRFDAHTNVWWRDGAYGHLARALHRAGVRGLAAVRKMHNVEIRRHFEEEHQRRMSAAHDAKTKYQEASQRLDEMRKVGDYGLPEQASSSSVVCNEAVSECLSLGETRLKSIPLWQKHRGIQGAMLPVEAVYETINSALADGRSQSAGERSLRTREYDMCGHQVMRLWAVIQSMEDMSQDRGEVIAKSEGRGRLSMRAETLAVGTDGLADVRDVRVRRAFVGLGICTRALGLPTALAWLAGAEMRLQASRGEAGVEDAGRCVEDGGAIGEATC